MEHLDQLEKTSNFFSLSGPGFLQDLSLNVICGPRLLGHGTEFWETHQRRTFIRESLKVNLHPL